MSLKQVKITDVKFDAKNFNKGSQIGDKLLEKSIAKFGFREAATLDKNNVLVGGNKRTAKAGENGFEDVVIIEADPKKVYALRYNDLDIDTPQGRELALALNQSAKANIVIDAEVVEAELGEAVCVEWGIQNAGYSIPEKDPFEDDGIEQKNKFGVIVMCETESDQQNVYSRLTGEGFNCKIVVV